MRWSTSALFVRDRSVEEVIGFLPDVFFFEPTGEVVDAEAAWAGRGEEAPARAEAESGESARRSRSSTGALRVRRPSASRLYLARTGAWCQMWDPDGRFAPRVELILEDGPRELRGTQALAVRFDWVRSTYAFWLFEDARLVRHASREAGKLVEERGSALPVEAAAEAAGPEEGFLWAVIRELTGLEPDPAARFAIWSIS